MNDLSKAFGSVLSELRRRAKMSQEELAFSAGVHRTYISQLERGLKSPSLDTIFLLAAAIEVKPSDLLRPYEERLRGGRRAGRKRSH